ncbi:MAG: leucine-rich repeat domain-containing protein [Clostridia bacterium]|nr:leucine-rich repeat domain-containing protein [Clostridia bacterium]
MKRKHILLVLCAAVAICAIPLAITGCTGEPEIEYGEWITVSAPTCEEEGVEMRSALVDASITQTRAIPATGHDWNDWETLTEATCLLAGVETRTCNTCENLDKRPIPALGHSWGKWVTTLEPDCESRGAQIRVCTRDEKHTELNYIPALKHDYGDWVITLAPTCTTDGVETRYCRNSNSHVQARPIEAYGHKWGKYVITKPETCTEEGEGKYVCANDASHTIITTIKACGHSYGDWVVSTPATENGEGEDIRYCVRDSAHTETRVAPAAGSDRLEYELNSDGTGYIVKKDYPYPTGTVYIPAMHKGLPVTAIKHSAFQSCKDIERVVILGNNLTTVGNMAFANCEKLQSLEFPEGLKYISSHVFYRCPSLKSVSFPSTVKNLGGTAGDHGTYISVFNMCSALESITVAEGNPYYKVDNGCLIEKSTNALLSGTLNAVIPKYVTSIERSAFMGSGIESVCIPASVAYIGRSAFSSCSKLKELTFENGALEVLGGFVSVVFSSSSLERIVLPDSLTAIGRYAFDCPSLREVVFGKNIKTIGSFAFSDCHAIEVCEIPASVTTLYGNSFEGSAVGAITIAEDNEKYFKDGNCIIERETNILVAGADDVVIPSYVTAIANSAFYERKIESVVIPNSVETIGNYAFAYCTSLKSLSFALGSGNLKVIGEDAFYNCTALTGVRLPDSLREIRSSAFKGCSALTSVTFGYSDGTFGYGASSLESIGSYAFADTGLKTFEIPATVTSVDPAAFRRCKGLTLTVHKDNVIFRAENGCLIEIATGEVVCDPSAE